MSTATCTGTASPSRTVEHALALEYAHLLTKQADALVTPPGASNAEALRMSRRRLWRLSRARNILKRLLAELPPL